jgi:valyl-tRNA synthetase
MDVSLRLLHPIIPFITEEIWQKLPVEGDSIMISSWPGTEEEIGSPEDEIVISRLQQIIFGVRNIRGEMNISPATKLHVIIKPENEEILSQIEPHVETIAGLARTEPPVIDSQAEKPDFSALAVADGVEVYVDLKGVVDFDAEQNRLEKGIQKIEKELTGINRKLSSEGFINKAPLDVIDKERQKKLELEEKLEKLRSSLEHLQASFNPDNP